MKKIISPSTVDSAIDPDFNIWCNDQRLQSLLNHFPPPSVKILRQSGLLSNALKFWIRREIALESLGKDYDDLNSADIDNALMKWSSSNWNHRLETLYLANKANLDFVNCSLLRVKDQFLAFELYQRLRSDEVSFEELSWKYGEGSERKHAGNFVDVRVETLPKALHQVLSKLKVAEVSKPHRFGEWFGILVLNSRTATCFDESVKILLLNRELNSWLNEVARKLELHLK